MTATIATEEGLKIPVLGAAYTDTKGRNVGKFFNNSEILCPSMLYFSPPQLLHGPTFLILNIEPKSVEFLVFGATLIAQDSAQVCVYQTSSDRRTR